MLMYVHCQKHLVNPEIYVLNILKE